MSSQRATTPLSGFTNLAFESNHVFRNILEALSRPGKVMTSQLGLKAPETLNSSATAFLLALADMETPVWLSPDIRSPQAIDHLKFHTGCPIVSDCKDATFAVVSAGSDFSFLISLPIGSSEQPHQSATLIVMIDDFEGPIPLTLTGPGIEFTHTLSPNPLPHSLLVWAQANQRLFPCGVDIVFATPSSLAALPRTTMIEV